MLSPSDIIVRPTSLTERLAAEGSAGTPPLPEPTPTTMAERFAPEAQKIPADDPVRHLAEPPVMPGLIAAAGARRLGRKVAPDRRHRSSPWSRRRSSSLCCGRA